MPISVPYVTSSDLPIQFGYVNVNLGVRAWVLPTNFAATRFEFPSSNTKSMHIINTGGFPLLFGALRCDSEADLPGQVAVGLGIPYAFPAALFPLAAAAAITPIEGNNCTRIPVGASLDVDFKSFQLRGNFRPTGVSGPVTTTIAELGYPLDLIFFSAVGGNTTADIMYINKFGTF